MAERRMFAKTIVESDAFIDMPMSSQLLYFHLGMHADDDGFVNAPRTTQRMIGASADDMRVLVAKGYLIPFESGVVVITHWRKHNYIQNDRKIDTLCTAEKALLTVEKGGVYKMDTQCIHDVYIADTQLVKVNKDRLVKDSTREGGRFTPPTRPQILQFCTDNNIVIDIDAFIDYYTSNGWMVGRSKMKSWQAAVRNWQRRDKEKTAPKGNRFADQMIKSTYTFDENEFVDN